MDMWVRQHPMGTYRLGASSLECVPNKKRRDEVASTPALENAFPLG